MSKLKILVTGANGQLGKELQVVSGLHPEFDYNFFSKEDLPINNNEKVQDVFATIQPAYCINCAAYTAVDKAEAEFEKAFSINGASVGTLAEACNKFGTKFIHISTDYVFNGKANKPYKEDFPVDPVNTYGASKLDGERLAADKNSESIIIRTSWVYSEFGNNFVKTMIRLMKEREQLGIVNDQSGSPTYAADLARIIIELIKSDKWKPGIYHYSNEGIITWFEFANAIKDIINSTCVINPITSAEFPTPAKRPSYSGFDKSKIKLLYGVEIPEWRTSLENCLQKLMA